MILRVGSSCTARWQGRKRVEGARQEAVLSCFATNGQSSEVSQSAVCGYYGLKLRNIFSWRLAPVGDDALIGFAEMAFPTTRTERDVFAREAKDTFDERLFYG